MATRSSWVELRHRLPSRSDLQGIRVGRTKYFIRSGQSIVVRTKREHESTRAILILISTPSLMPPLSIRKLTDWMKSHGKIGTLSSVSCTKRVFLSRGIGSVSIYFLCAKKFLMPQAIRRLFVLLILPLSFHSYYIHRVRKIDSRKRS